MLDKQPQKYSLSRRNRESLIERPQSETRESRKSTSIGAGKSIADELGADIKPSRKRRSSDIQDKSHKIDSSSDSDENQENTYKRPSLESDCGQTKFYAKKRKVLSQMSPQSQLSDTNPSNSFDSIASTPMFAKGSEIGSGANSPATWTYGKSNVSKRFKKSDVLSSDSDDSN